MPSSVIRDHSYDDRTSTLFITFVSGELYAYFDVPPAVYAGFRRAISKGRYFAFKIRNRYACQRMETANV